MMRLTDKPQCRVYPPGTKCVEALLYEATGDRVVVIVDCWGTEDLGSKFRRYGKTADTGCAVEVFEGLGEDEWFAIECPYEEPTT